MNAIQWIITIVLLFLVFGCGFDLIDTDPHYFDYEDEK